MNKNNFADAKFSAWVKSFHNILLSSRNKEKTYTKKAND